MALGLGLTMGPVIGSILYRWLYYAGTFYFFTAFILVFGMTSVFFVPSRINHPFE